MMGEPCSAPAVGTTNRCVMHSGRAEELGSKGGRRRAIYSPEELKQFAAPTSAGDLRDPGMNGVDWDALARGRRDQILASTDTPSAASLISAGPS
jgi:hypothetical protein